jgi:hypothetical protein
MSDGFGWGSLVCVCGGIAGRLLGLIDSGWGVDPLPGPALLFFFLSISFLLFTSLLRLSLSRCSSPSNRVIDWRGSVWVRKKSCGPLFGEWSWMEGRKRREGRGVELEMYGREEGLM